MKEHREVNVRKQPGGLQHPQGSHKDAAAYGNRLMESTAVVNRWTEHCSGLYNFELHPDTSPLQSNQTPTQEPESPPVMRKEVGEAVRSLEAGKSPGVDNIPMSC